MNASSKQRDFVEELARRVATFVIAAYLGLPDGRPARRRFMFLDVGAALSAVPASRAGR